MIMKVFLVFSCFFICFAIIYILNSYSVLLKEREEYNLYKQNAVLIINKSEQPILTHQQYKVLSETEKLIFWNKKGIIKE